MISAFRLSLVEWNALTPQKAVGLKNFITLVKDPVVLNSYLRTFHFSGISVAAINVLAFVFALMLSSRLLRHTDFLQSLIFLPVVLSTVAVGVVWEFMYQSTGLIPIILRKLIGTSPAWLTDTSAAPYAIIITYVWKSVGYYMVIYIAGLMDVPVSYYEAARIDGAGFWGQLFYITIPNLRNTFALAVISCIIFTFGQFDIQFVITKGGPGALDGDPRSADLPGGVPAEQVRVFRGDLRAVLHDAAGVLDLPAAAVQVRRGGRLRRWARTTPR